MHGDVDRLSSPSRRYKTLAARTTCFNQARNHVMKGTRGSTLKILASLAAKSRNIELHDFGFDNCRHERQDFGVSSEGLRQKPDARSDGAHLVVSCRAHVQRQVVRPQLGFRHLKTVSASMRIYGQRSTAHATTSTAATSATSPSIHYLSGQKVASLGTRISDNIAEHVHLQEPI